MESIRCPKKKYLPCQTELAGHSHSDTATQYGASSPAPIFDGGRILGLNPAMTGEPKVEALSGSSCTGRKGLRSLTTPLRLRGYA